MGHIIGIVKSTDFDFERYRIKWLNTINEFDKTCERTIAIDMHFKKINYAKMLALLM